jgi:hypothetical protein
MPNAKPRGPLKSPSKRKSPPTSKRTQELLARELLAQTSGGPMPGGPSTRKSNSLGLLLGRFLAHFEVRKVCAREVALIKPTHRNGWLRPQIEAKLSRLHPECPDHRELRRLVNLSIDLLEAVDEDRFDPGPDWPAVEARLLRALAYLLSEDDAIPDHLPDGFDDDMREFQSLANHAGALLAAFESRQLKK